MTKVSFFERDDGIILGFEAKGHAGYGEYGSDIVCAAISALTQGVSLGLTEVLKADAQVRQDEETGFLQCFLSTDTDAEKIAQAQILFRTLKVALTAISQDYPGTIRIIIRERR